MSRTGDGHAAGTPISPWIAAWAHLAAPGGSVLDLACGGGRHARWFASRGHPVLAVDRDPGIVALSDADRRIETRVADLEQGPWPTGGARFSCVVVTNYLHRPLFQSIVAAVAPGGILLYETFAVGHEKYGRPARPEFLLRAGELLDVVAGALRVVAFEDRLVDVPRPAMVQRICAVREAHSV